MPLRVLLGAETAPQLAAPTRAAAAALVGSELHLLADQGHVAIDTAPDVIAQHVRETWRQAHR
jgi:pimeloyl-ACP methyl ester carboxylesterase